jgi:excisionase family DNA binding protein
MQTIPSDALLTAAELAARLGVKPETILRWHRGGKIPARRLSHKVLRFNLAHVVAALESRQSLEGRGVAQ